MTQFAVAAVSDRRKLLINKNRRSETVATAEKMDHYRQLVKIDNASKDVLTNGLGSGNN